LTHCNAGALATAGYGTALGVIRAAREMGKTIDVFADETRPFLQGARLTVWELQQDSIPTTLITDNMAGHFVRDQGRRDAVLLKLPHRQSRALQKRTRLIREHVDRLAHLARGANHSQGGAVSGSRERSCVAVRE